MEFTAGHNRNLGIVSNNRRTLSDIGAGVGGSNTKFMWFFFLQTTETFITLLPSWVVGCSSAVTSFRTLRVCISRLCAVVIKALFFVLSPSAYEGCSSHMMFLETVATHTSRMYAPLSTCNAHTATYQFHICIHKDVFSYSFPLLSHGRSVCSGFFAFNE